MVHNHYKLILMVLNAIWVYICLQAKTKKKKKKINDFILFKPIIPKFVKTKKIVKYYLMEFSIFNELWIFLPETTQNDKSINLFCLVFVTLEFLISVFFSYSWHYRFPLFLYSICLAFYVSFYFFFDLIIFS